MKRSTSALFYIAVATILIGCSGYVSLPQAIDPASFVISSPTPVVIVPTAEPPPIPTDFPESPTLFIPTLDPLPDDIIFSIGDSVEGRPIWAWQFGDGDQTIILVGGIHGGYEANGIILSEELVDYFRRFPSDVLPSIRLIIIPAANPDGLEQGQNIDGRFNANGVDLNRNWGCEWSDTAYLRDREVSPGPRPFSEPESLALRALFIAAEPVAVVFYHSQLGAIFMGQCGDVPAAYWMGDLLARATGYRHERNFAYYEVSGDASNWLAERGVPAAVVELETRSDPEFEQNLSGVMALQCHFAGEASLPQDQQAFVAHTCGLDE
jgi:hypothetical protein